MVVSDVGPDATRWRDVGIGGVARALVFAIAVFLALATVFVRTSGGRPPVTATWSVSRLALLGWRFRRRWRHLDHHHYHCSRLVSLGRLGGLRRVRRRQPALCPVPPVGGQTPSSRRSNSWVRLPVGAELGDSYVYQQVCVPVTATAVSVWAALVDDIEALPEPIATTSPSAMGITGLDTWFWFDGVTQAGPVAVSWTDGTTGVTFDLEGVAWIGTITWDTGDDATRSARTRSPTPTLPQSEAPSRTRPGHIATNRPRTTTASPTASRSR